MRLWTDGTCTYLAEDVEQLRDTVKATMGDDEPFDDEDWYDLTERGERVKVGFERWEDALEQLCELLDAGADQRVVWIERRTRLLGPGRHEQHVYEVTARPADWCRLPNPHLLCSTEW